jgi:hypothetical protein
MKKLLTTEEIQDQAAAYAMMGGHLEQVTGRLYSSGILAAYEEFFQNEKDSDIVALTQAVSALSGEVLATLASSAKPEITSEKMSRERAEHIAEHIKKVVFHCLELRREEGL